MENEMTNTNLQIGQRVAILRYSSSLYQSCPCRSFDTITAINKQFITTESGKKFNIRTGKEWGQGDSYYAQEFSTKVEYWEQQLAAQTLRRNRDAAWENIKRLVEGTRNPSADTVKSIQSLIESYALQYTLQYIQE
jgi:hypothetical protein